MNDGPNPEAERETAFAVLRKFARRRANSERCELCSAEVGSEHQHLLEVSDRKILCACDACAVLFSGQAGASYRRVPRRRRVLNDFHLTDAEWEALMLPINLAFFYHDTNANRVVAMYPSPAGAMESLLSLSSWSVLEEQNPELRKMEPDVEALLINRVGTTHEYFLVPIDECYRLIGLIRSNWRGLSGGTEVWKKIQEFFDALHGKCGDIREEVTSA
jgi:hypothetical protein